MTLAITTPYLSISGQAELGDLRGAGARYRANIEALRLLRQLQADGRAPGSLDRDEQLTLARYTAFGEAEVLNRAFTDAARSGPATAGEGRWAPNAEMAELTSAEEQALIKRTALTAFYTPLDVVRVIWEALARLGLCTLPRLRVLEPAAGVAHFVSGMPEALRERAEVTCVEIDQITAQIVPYLHPDARVVNAPFQQAELPEGYFDLAISNVPFSDIPVADSRYERHLTRTLHDYCFAKALRLVRPGGIVCFLTSFGTMDKKDVRARSWLAQQGRLLGAFRLPNGVFKDLAGTESGTDLVILQRYAPGETPAAAPWVRSELATFPRIESRSVTTGSFRHGAVDGGVRVSTHYTDDPARIIGTPYTTVKPGMGLAFFVEAPAAGAIGATLGARLRAELPLGVVTTVAAPVVTTLAPRPAAHSEEHLSIPPTVAGSDADRARGMLAVYQVAKDLIRLEVMAAPVSEQERARTQLNEAYDDFVARFGALHARANRRVLKDMPELAFLLSLESDVSERGGKVAATKVPIFARATIRPERAEVRGLSANDALLVCLDEIGRVDVERITHICGRSRADVLEELKGVLYRAPNPDVEIYETADQFLSGNIREKLRQVKALAAIDPKHAASIPALEAALPTPLTPGEIIANLGATWVAPEDVADFIVAIIPEFRGGTVDYNAVTKRWEVKDAAYARHSVNATVTWGTTRADAIDIIAASLNGRLVLVQDTVAIPGGGERRVTNEPETMAAQEKQGQLKERFASWLWEDAARAERLAAVYNERYNSVRLRQYDGAHLRLPGMNTAILRGGDLSDWQKDAVWQILQSRSTLIGHVVGAGKTFELIAAAREAKRMGLANKPMAVVPNHLVEQWAREAARLYPGMRILAMSPEEFAKERRGRFLSMVATGDWDLVIVAHTSFKSLPVSAATLKAFTAKRVDALRAFLEDITGDEEVSRRTIKEVEKRIAAHEARLERALEAIERDSERTISWDELGVDMLLVDECHEFKNLEIETRMDRVAGVPRGGSQRAFDLWLKTWDLRRRGGKVVFATGTPVANTLAEVFVFMRYLQEDLLEELDIAFFDSWVASFAQTQMAFEMRPDGSGFRMNTRLSKFVNLPELATLWRQCLNVRTAEQLNLPRPRLVTGKPVPVIASCSPRLKLFVAGLVERVERIKRGAVDPTEDNMLKVTGDGRRAALDIRLIQGGPEEPDCKINLVVRNVARLYSEFAEQRAAQLIFCDLSTPKGASDGPARADDVVAVDGEAVGMEAAQRGFVYHAIRQKLTELGIPREEIAFIHEHGTKMKRDQLFADVKAGRVRVLLGSTATMGTGMNVQERLIALHHLDAPWRPCDIEQREGRILRQGNIFPEVFVFQYVTEGSFDGYLWQLLENKARFISHIMAGEVTARTAEDIAEVVLTAAEIKAIASGNPKIVEKVKLEAELGRLDRVRGVWVNARIAMRNELERLGHAVGDIERDQERLAHVIAYRDSRPAAEFAATVHAATGAPTTYSKRDEAGKAVRAAMLQRNVEQVRAASTGSDLVGEYRGFTLQSRTVWAFGKPDGVALSLACSIDGRRWLLNEEPLATGTDAGVFISVDATLRNLERTAESLVRRAERLRERSTEITAELAKPWGGEAQYTRMSRTLARLDKELAGEEVPADAALTPAEEAELEAELAARAATPPVDVDALLANAGSLIRPTASVTLPSVTGAAPLTAEAATVERATALPIPAVDLRADADASPMVVTGSVRIAEPASADSAPLSLPLFGSQAETDVLLTGKGKRKGKRSVATEGQLSLFGDSGQLGRF